MLCPDATASCNENVRIHRQTSQTKNQDNHLQPPLAKRQSNFFLLINVHMIKRIDQFICGSCYCGFLLWYLLGSPNILLSSWFCPCLSSFPKSWLSFPSPLLLDMKTLKVETALFWTLCIFLIFNSVMNQHKLHWIFGYQSSKPYNLPRLPVLPTHQDSPLFAPPSLLFLRLPLSSPPLPLPFLSQPL